MSVRDVDIAYSGGLFDGEGTVDVHASGWSIRIGMTDLEPVVRMKEIWGGTLTGPYRGDGNRKQFFVWSLYGYAKVEDFYLRTKEWLSPRRQERFERLLERKPFQPPVSPDCGRNSIAGRTAHRKRGEALCAGCREAWNIYQRAYREKRRQCP